MTRRHESIRVGFVLNSGDWLGGINYLRNLFAAIRNLPGQPITPVIFTGVRQRGAFPDFAEISVVRSAIFDRKSLAWLLRKVVAKISKRDIMLQTLLQRHNVTVLSHSSHLGNQKEIKTIGWIPDFQHVHLPEFFTQEECGQRNREFKDLCETCDKVIVSSECARADLQTFSPGHAHKAELLRFVASPLPLSDATDLVDLQSVYGFQGNYFLLPNQFWAHKNHRIVLRALQILNRQDTSFVVLATGSTSDYRNPSFFPSLMEYAAECDVLENFRVLGKIPFDHLVGLMQHAVAFINPSKFEGWSTSVEEAKSMGKQIVLSDIPVHREQEPERGFFFPADDAAALASAMSAAYNEFDAGKDAAAQAAAGARFPERQRAFAETYRRIVKSCL